MASYEIQGTLVSRKQKEQITEKFAKQEFVIVTDETYPQHILMQCVNDKCSLLDSLKKNDVIKVSFNLNGKPYKDKQGNERVMTNINAYKIEKLGTQTEQPQSTPPKTQAPPPQSDVDDLPF